MPQPPRRLGQQLAPLYVAYQSFYSLWPAKLLLRFTDNPRVAPAALRFQSKSPEGQGTPTV